MLFGLKNTGTTYQWLVNKVFKEQLKWNIEAYINDMLVKNVKTIDHIKDLEEAFNALRCNQMKLNLLSASLESCRASFSEFWLLFEELKPILRK